MDNDIDVLVIGGGIAGITASIEAARAGARVALACAGPLFGGSSFYPGTWGLGLIGPKDEAAEEDLVATIERVGCGVTDPRLVETFVRGIRPAISWLEDDLGVRLLRPQSEQSAREATFIPCFDHKTRLWRGIEREPFMRAAGRELERLGVQVLERCELMGLVHDGCDVREMDGCAEGREVGDGVSDGTTGRSVAGAILYNRTRRSFEEISAGALVLAAGGTGGLFARSLTSGDVLSSVHGLALDAGCSLVNIEFMQMMPGLVQPVAGVVFNEKTFRYACINDRKGILPQSQERLEELLETRSGHGPFTTRLGDEAVDLAIDAAGPEGVAVRFDFPGSDVPEFVRTFSGWLEHEHGITPRDELRVAMYAHAANGGIRIDERACTGMDGIFACGECTGGMHGADRLGGLSSANGLVFGRIAGRNAAHAALKARAGEAVGRVRESLYNLRRSAAPLDMGDAARLTTDLKRLMSTYCMIDRNEAGLTAAIEGIEALQGELGYHCAHRGCIIAPDEALARGVRLSSQLTLAHAMASAMLARRKSLGSHHRGE